MFTSLSELLDASRSTAACAFANSEVQVNPRIPAVHVVSYICAHTVEEFAVAILPMSKVMLV